MTAISATLPLSPKISVTLDNDGVYRDLMAERRAESATEVVAYHARADSDSSVPQPASFSSSNLATVMPGQKTSLIATRMWLVEPVNIVGGA